MFSEREQASSKAPAQPQDEDADGDVQPEPADELCNRVVAVLREVAEEQAGVIQGICRFAAVVSWVLPLHESGLTAGSGLRRDSADEMAHAMAHVPSMEGNARSIREIVLGQNSELHSVGQAFHRRLTELHAAEQTQASLGSCQAVSDQLTSSAHCLVSEQQ